MFGQNTLMYVLLGICVAVLALVGHQLYRQHIARLKHNGSHHRSRRWFRFGRRSHRNG